MIIATPVPPTKNFTHRNGKDRPVVLVATLDHGVGRRKKLHNHANDGNGENWGLQHHGGSVWAAATRAQQAKVNYQEDRDGHV